MTICASMAILEESLLLLSRLLSACSVLYCYLLFSLFLTKCVRSFTIYWMFHPCDLVWANSTIFSSRSATSASESRIFAWCPLLFSSLIQLSQSSMVFVFSYDLCCCGCRDHSNCLVGVMWSTSHPQDVILPLWSCRWHIEVLCCYFSCYVDFQFHNLNLFATDSWHALDLKFVLCFSKLSQLCILNLTFCDFGRRNLRFWRPILAFSDVAFHLVKRYFDAF